MKEEKNIKDIYMVLVTYMEYNKVKHNIKYKDSFESLADLLNEIYMDYKEIIEKEV